MPPGGIGIGHQVHWALPGLLRKEFELIKPPAVQSPSRRAKAFAVHMQLLRGWGRILALPHRDVVAVLGSLNIIAAELDR